MNQSTVEGGSGPGDKSSMSAAIELTISENEVNPQMSDYKVRHINAIPGGQVLDCTVSRDEAGMPRVEMVFCINPLLQPSGDGTATNEWLNTGRSQLITLPSDDVTVSSCQSEFVSPDDLLLEEPPTTCYRSSLTASSAAGSVTSPDLLDDIYTSEAAAAAAAGHQHHYGDAAHWQPVASQRVVSDEHITTDNEKSQMGNAEDQVNEWKRRLERRHIVRSMVLLIASAVDRRDGKATISLVVVITSLFLMLRYVDPPFITTISLVCFTVCLVEFLLLLPTTDNYISALTAFKLLDDESRLESIYAGMSSVERRLRSFLCATLTLKKEQPVAFFAVTVCSFYLISQFGQIVNGYLLVYLAALSAVTASAVVNRSRRCLKRAA